MASIKIRAIDDGTFVVCRNGEVMASGLTRDQAERCATVLGWLAQGA
ncbi:hypothetical protein GOFOIKOB_5603 [Methylobacterium tardum]|nr:hypothetical protein [Methylobacterium tardum]URD34619.1 hypothetical protein M6G65_18660 [Methylobacterium tardum]GJE52530.1 hypothetical protein GOFOIKOB_5603 [Methylobacterium tardum]